MVGFNEYEGPFGSIRFGGGFLYDFAAFSQDANSKEQFPDLSPEWKIRDTRILFQRKFQDQTADQLERRRHVRLGRREVGDAADTRDHRCPGNLGPYRRWPYQRRLLDEQGHDRIWGLDHGAPTHQRRDPSHPRRRRQMARLRAESEDPLESWFLRGRTLRRADILLIREPDLRAIRLGAHSLDRRRKPAAHRRQRALRQDEGREDQAESSSGSLGGSFLHGHRRVRREPLEHDLDRDVLAAAFGYRGRGVLFPERRRAGFGRPVLPRRAKRS